MVNLFVVFLLTAVALGAIKAEPRIKNYYKDKKAYQILSKSGLYLNKNTPQDIRRILEGQSLRSVVFEFQKNFSHDEKISVLDMVHRKMSKTFSPSKWVDYWYDSRFINNPDFWRRGAQEWFDVFSILTEKVFQDAGERFHANKNEHFFLFFILIIFSYALSSESSEFRFKTLPLSEEEKQIVHRVDTKIQELKFVCEGVDSLIEDYPPSKKTHWGNSITQSLSLLYILSLLGYVIVATNASPYSNLLKAFSHINTLDIILLPILGLFYIFLFSGFLWILSLVPKVVGRHIEIKRFEGVFFWLAAGAALAYFLLKR